MQAAAHQLARQLYGDDAKRVSGFTNWLLDVCARARDKEFLLIHNPGGWGNHTLEHCLQWERSLVTGIKDSVERLGYSCQLVQYFRSGSGWLEWMRDLRQQFHFFATKAGVLAAGVVFITQHLDNVKVILIGVSQGAAFNNAVMQQLPRLQRVYSIELGMFFPHLSRRVITERTLALDSNGLVPDAVVRREILPFTRAYLAAPLRWIKHLFEGRLVSMVSCVAVRGHNYDWSHPQVRQQVVSFLEANFGTGTR